MNAKNKRGLGLWVPGAGLAVLMGLMFCGCGHAPVSVTVSDEQLVQDELTNDIVGYSRTIDISYDSLASTNGTQKYDVTAEFINRVGGVERTNMIYRIFDFSSPSPDGGSETNRAAEIDSDWRAAVMAEQYQEFLEGLTNKYPAVSGAQ